MSNKTTGEIAADILVALIAKAPAHSSVQHEAQRAAEAYKIIFAAVQRPM